MADYTPTTEEVRESYVLMQKCGAYPKPEAEFNRWLAEVKAQACGHTFAQELEERSFSELIRIAKADAWEEGLMSMKPRLPVWVEKQYLPKNPYRQGEEQ